MAAPVDAAQLNGTLRTDEAKGANIHTFDPDATPSEKAAAAGKGRSELKSVVATEMTQSAKELTLDNGANNGPPVIPTIRIDDADFGSDEKEPEKEAPRTPELEDGIPGAMPQGPAPAIPDWYKVGWRAVGGIDDPAAEEGEETDKGILDAFLSEQFYGSWYHNAAIIFFAVISSHFLTRFGFGWGWLFIVLAFCSTYYSTSMTRVRRRARDDIQRELVKNHLFSEFETADWMNTFLDRFWLIYEPVLSATIVSSVDQILSTNTPAFLDSIRLSTFTLGTKAPRIEKVNTFRRTPDDQVMMDWQFTFMPNDVSDMTHKQAAKKVNPKIVLAIRLGKGMATAAMPVLLEDISFSGRIRIRMKLMTSFPHVQVVDLSFLEPPVIDYVLKPVGGETFGFDIGNIPGLSSFIREMTHATLGPMMYEPNVFTLNLEQLMSGQPLDTAIGVVQVTVQHARGIKGSKIGGGTPDPFVGLSINEREELARTNYKESTFNPTWMETKFLLVNSLTESLVLTTWDYNEVRKNSLIGVSTFDLAKLEEDATHEDIETDILKEGKPRGTLRYDVSYYPVLKPEEGVEVLDTSVGIVRLTIHQAKDLDATKSMSGDLNPFARVHLGNTVVPVHTTPLFKHTNNPVWESSTEFLCSDKASSVITIKVIDDRDFLKDPLVGYLSVRLEDLLAAKLEAGRDWWPLSGCKSGKVRMSAEWKPLNMAGSLHGSDTYTPPIGVVRLLLDRATDVKNVEATLGGKSDPYVRVTVNGLTKGRTEVVNNNLNPVWDQIIYIPVHNLKETLFMECMDYQHLTKDRSLGHAEVSVSDLAEAAPEDHQYPFKSTGKKDSTDPLHLEKGSTFKGHLHYAAEFIPALALQGVKFDAVPNELQRAVEREGVIGADSSSMSSSDIENHAVPDGVTAQGPIGRCHRKGDRSTDTTKTTNTTRTNGTSDGPVTTIAETEETGVSLSRDELLTNQSGIIVFNVLGGPIEKKARLEVLLDDGYWPAFSTVKATSTQAKWDYVGEGFVKELDFGRVWLRLNENDEGEKDDIIAEWKGDAKAFLEKTLSGPSKFRLSDEDGKETSAIEIEARYVPVPVKLEPRESVNNMGMLRVDLISATGLQGVDRSGKSDPYAVFSLNGQKVFKSQTQKKTLDPVWNENFVASVPSRVAADFEIEIFDWDRVGTSDSLGEAKIDLSALEPFQAFEQVIELKHPKHGDKGQVRVRMMFQPEIIAKSRKNTSTFSVAGRALTTVGGAPVSVGKGVFHGVAGVFGRGKDDSASDPFAMVPTPAATGQASQPVSDPDAAPTAGSMFPSMNNGNGQASSEPGTLRVTVLDAKDLVSNDWKPYVTLRLGDKEHKTKHGPKSSTPEWNESFTFTAGTFTPKLFTWMHDHKTIGKDKLIGEADIDIWRHLTPGVSGSADITVELREGSGLMRVGLEFDADRHPLAASSSNNSLASERPGLASPSRFSLRGRRPTERED